MTDEMRAVCDNLFIATDDGSAGHHGLVTGLVRELVEVQGRSYDEVVTIGPMIMMKFVAQTTASLGLPTIASLNTLMVDGTGMCGACRVTVGGKVYFACVDGPEFDAHKVDFDEAMRRQTMYRTWEGAELDRVREEHKCKIGLDE
jgi:ferredoxin--NADP+ reductase